MAALTVASECPAGQGLNDTNGVNINIHYGNSSTDEPSGQNNNIFNVNPTSNNRGELCVCCFINMSTIHVLSAKAATAFWSVWSEWGGCSRSCGNATRTRTRDCQVCCSGSHLAHPGNCDGPYEETTTCNIGKCPGMLENTQ